MVFIPEDITTETLHCTNIAPFDLEGHRLNHRTLECPALVHQGAQAMFPRFPPYQAIVKGFMQLLQIVAEPVYIVRCPLSLRDSKALVSRATCR
jgi:hypothetical protein